MMHEFDRITRSEDVLHGKARVRGQRITVAAIVRQLASGYDIDQVLEAYPTLEREDVQQALNYAAMLASTDKVSVAA